MPCTVGAAARPGPRLQRRLTEVLLLKSTFFTTVRHPFQAILCLTLLGLVCGQTTMAHIALFAKMHWPVLKEPLGFLRDHPPHATTISRTLSRVSHEQLQGALTGWVAQVVADQELNASVDGKWARQSEDANGNPLVMVKCWPMT